MLLPVLISYMFGNYEPTLKFYLILFHKFSSLNALGTCCLAFFIFLDVTGETEEINCNSCI